MPDPISRDLSHQIRSHQYFSAEFPFYIVDVNQGALAEHTHEFFEMVYVRRGRGEHFINGTGFPIQAGDFYVISPGEYHGYRPDIGSSLRIVNLLWMPSVLESVLSDERLLAQNETETAQRLVYIEPLLRHSAKAKTGRHENARFAHRLHLAGRDAYRVETLLDEMQREQTSGGPGSELMLRHLFCALLVLLSRVYQAQHQHKALRADGADRKSDEANGKEIVGRAIEFIEEHYTEPIRVREVAAHTALSESRLSHLFKQHTGRGLIEYLHQYRIARACNLLIESDLQIQDIASEIGYGDLRFFHRTFRRHAGCNPRQYRQHFGDRRQVA